MRLLERFNLGAQLEWDLEKSKSKVSCFVCPRWRCGAAVVSETTVKKIFYGDQSDNCSLSDGSITYLLVESAALFVCERR